MRHKTDRLVKLFPDIYAARETESVLYKLLDAIGAELTRADEAVKELLKSHWVDYASGKGLDGLAAIYGVNRRLIRGGSLETDDAFRARLKAVVPLFTGGGTRQAVLGAVRSALGLPFNLDDLHLPPGYQALRDDLEKLVTMEEFSPEGQRILVRTVTQEDQVSQLILVTDIPTVREERPRIQWRFTSGGGRLLSLELLPLPDQPGSNPVGVRSIESLAVGQGDTLDLFAGPDGEIIAVKNLEDVSDHFTNLDGSTPAILPQVPTGRREWRFQAQSAVFDIGVFDADDTFGLPGFEVEMHWLRYQPLTFDVYVPYFLQNAVANLREQHAYSGRLFAYEGLPLPAVVDVVDQTRAAGVKATVHFSLNFSDIHQQDEVFALAGDFRAVEDAGAAETFTVTSVSDFEDHHDTGETMIIGGVFDLSPFDLGHGFSE